MHEKRLQLALEKIPPSEWEKFEKFASAFLVDEFPDLRTTASPSGDDGRDAELFSPFGESKVVLQYSVTPKWGPKITATAKRIKKTLPDATQLVYVSNHVIGAAADDLKKSIRKDYGIAVDIRDRSYFLERFQGNDHLEVVAASLAKVFVDPFLESQGVIQAKAQALTSGENRAAHLFLELQWQDDTRDKGLTKTAFDALVRMSLRATHAENKLSRLQIREQISDVLKAGDKEFVNAEVDKSLARLTKAFIRHYSHEDEFCLTHEESERLKSQLAETEVHDQDLRNEILSVIRAVMPEAQASEAVLPDLVSACRAGVEQFLFQRGELFVAALHNGQLQNLGYEIVKKIAEDQLKARKLSAISPVAFATAIERVLTASGPAVGKYLRGIADTYTLLAFLRETPDVQQAVKKMFSSGEIWLDTSIVLPLISEDLLPDDQYQFRRLIQIASAAGLRIKVAHGVIEEVERHINRCLICARTSPGAWQGAYPYLYSSYIANGAASSKFSQWIENFCGRERPEDDIADFLLREFKIVTTDISEDASKGDQALRAAVKEAWTKVHQERRQDFDQMLAMRLADHDTDNYVGVIVRRQVEAQSAFGYSSWWLTLDHMAFVIGRRIAPLLAGKVPSSPVMSADFLTNYLAFGPLREKIGRNKTNALPVSIDPSLVKSMSPELVEIADRVRGESSELPEHLVRRKVRDALDAARRRTGLITDRGLQVTESITI